MAWLLPPLLDVYYYDSQAVQALLHGVDPYGHSFTGIPAWLATPGASNVFAYLPAVVLFLAPFGTLWDVRLGLIVADVAVALGIYLLGGRRSGPAAILYLFIPFTLLFSTSYPNDTLVAMCFFGLAVLSEVRGKRGVSAACLGVSIAASQFIWLILPLFAAWYLRTRRLKEFAISTVVAAAVILPFLFWNSQAFIADTVLFEFQRQPEALVTPMAFGFNINPTLSGLVFTLFGVGVPLVFRISATVVVLAYFVYRSRGLRSTVLSAAWFLAVAVLLLPTDFSWWYLELPFQAFLIRFALTRDREGPKGANA